MLIHLREQLTCLTVFFKALEASKASGLDEIPAKLLKETASVIAPSSCKIFNKSLQLGSLPSAWKLANVVPVHKKDAKEHVENLPPHLSTPNSVQGL